MAKLNDASDMYAFLSALEAPRWQTPASLKRSYRGVLASEKLYEPVRNNTLRQYGNYQPVQKTAQYKQLVEHYNREYLNNALAAAGQVKAALPGAAAYADAVNSGMLNAYMAQRTAAMPALLGAAHKAYESDKKAKADAVQAMRAQKRMHVNAARTLFQKQLQAVRKEAESKQQAHAAQAKALEQLLTKRLAYEKALAKRK